MTGHAPTAAGSVPAAVSAASRVLRPSELPRASSATGRATTTALEVLRGNRRTGRSAELGADYAFTCPSPTSYPFQWNWDSCFHAIALSRVAPDLARREVDSLLLGADPGGFLPHMLLWEQDARAAATEEFRIAMWDHWRTATIAPPVLARAVAAVHRATGDDAWLRSVLPAVARHFDWLHAARAGRDGLLVIGQPDESGLDSTPKYDAVLGLDPRSPAVGPEWHAAMRALIGERPAAADPSAFPSGRFQWVDVLLNTVYADGLGCLADLAGADGARFRARAATVLRSLLDGCWDGRRGAFWDVDAVSGRRAEVLTASSLFPLVLTDLPEPVVTALVDHLVDEDEFWLPYPVPSVAATEPSFDADFATGAIFRGSTWVNLNWYLHLGLRAHGRHDVADELAARTVAMTAAAGMRECYGPFDARGHGAHDFGWSALVLDLPTGAGA
ncbi:hypothetical protein KCV87_33320 [Actinosynnema pretiosum subsp. pretiosum]|uniref:Mannosylglycerate hydrolase MGH1-like glycoside hydrolase domain-containing protein n=2 Tax=Actinosynnema TaxID=40566 RepID=C6WKB1_ACTMD|nr:hypothetical protein [Actinosynnema mirum]ACU38324.1 hypothetical protein Amir_4480 [Actinosynnema mirum DSM 43827]AXX31848.1 hypothetical protein APASM_4483 [Actinosynnema pretiosum subsp. pretiosum]QUF04165.1 hypothetical protein KCV87_33320 [Actinosynnema pretiosum subsp. pretiosum]